MASRDKILFLLGEKKAEDLLIREFFSKFPADQQNKIAKSILCTVIENAGPNWNPILDGYPFLKGKDTDVSGQSSYDFNRSLEDTAKVMSVVNVIDENSEVFHEAETDVAENMIDTNIKSVKAVDDDEENPIPVVTGFTKKSKNKIIKKI